MFSDSSSNNNQTGFDWALFGAGVAVGFFSGWAKKIVFGVIGKKK